MASKPQEYKPEQYKLSGPQRTADEKFYSRKAWRVARKRQIAMEPLCRECGEPAICVDHITPLASGGEPFDPANLQSLCTRCHTIKTRGEMCHRGE